MIYNIASIQLWEKNEKSFIALALHSFRRVCMCPSLLTLCWWLPGYFHNECCIGNNPMAALHLKFPAASIHYCWAQGWVTPASTGLKSSVCHYTQSSYCQWAMATPKMKPNLPVSKVHAQSTVHWASWLLENLRPLWMLAFLSTLWGFFLTLSAPRYFFAKAC